jgi:hypothetical protein
LWLLLLLRHRCGSFLVRLLLLLLLRVALSRFDGTGTGIGTGIVVTTIGISGGAAFAVTLVERFVFAAIRCSSWSLLSETIVVFIKARLPGTGGCLRRFLRLALPVPTAAAVAIVFVAVAAVAASAAFLGSSLCVGFGRELLEPRRQLGVRGDGSAVQRIVAAAVVSRIGGVHREFFSSLRTCQERYVPRRRRARNPGLLRCRRLRSSENPPAMVAFVLFPSVPMAGRLYVEK